MSNVDFDPRLYLVTDSSFCGEDEFLQRVEAALEGGVTLLQLREKDVSTREYVDLAVKVHQISRRFDVPLIIDDRVDVALAVGAEGVHLGATDMPLSVARRLMGAGRIVGATAKTVPSAQDAYQEGADYLGVGAIFPTTTKVVTVLTSVDTLADICEAVPIPVNAIGGLNSNNIDVLAGVAIQGVCVVSAIMKASDPMRAAIDLKARMGELGL